MIWLLLFFPFPLVGQAEMGPDVTQSGIYVNTGDANILLTSSALLRIGAWYFNIAAML